MISHIELERLLSAGVVDQQFRELLLKDPLRAAEGYHADRFQLSAEEKDVLLRIRTDDYQKLVRSVARWISQKRSDSQIERQSALP